MLKHFIEGDLYFIVNENNDVCLSIKLENDYPENQLEITTSNSVYAGPVDFLSVQAE